MTLIHPSSLGLLMTSAKSKKDSALSVGAISYCDELAKEQAFNYKSSITSKYLDKGLICEDDSIELYNDVFFTNYKKNTERRENKWLTGECDINAKDKIIDIKTSWSLQTFPATEKAAINKKYEWQGRAYMMLWDKDLFELAYCMVSTPVELIGMEDEAIHYVDHIPDELRVTTVQYQRDKDLEELIKIKVEAAQSYIKEQVKLLLSKHFN